MSLFPITDKALLRLFIDEKAVLDGCVNDDGVEGESDDNGFRSRGGIMNAAEEEKRKKVNTKRQ